MRRLHWFCMRLRLSEAGSTPDGIVPVQCGLHLRPDLRLPEHPPCQRASTGEPVMHAGMLAPAGAGLVLSAGVAVFARTVGFDRDRAFYPTVTIVIAGYYVLFGVMSGSARTVVIESMGMALFAAAAVAGFKSSAWIVVAALAGHGVFDAVHGYLVSNAGVPAWWPAWCLTYDVGAAAGLAWLLLRGRPAVDGRG